MPGVWLFHIGNAHSFLNVIPATASDPIAVPQKQAFQTTTEYPPGEYETDLDSFDDEQEYSVDRDFPDPDATQSPHPGHDASQTSSQNQEADSELSPLDPYKAEITLSPDPQIDHTAPTDVPPEEIVDSVHLVPKDTLLEAYPIHPDGEVVTVEGDVEFDSGGEFEQNIAMLFLHSFLGFKFFFYFCLGILSAPKIEQLFILPLSNFLSPLFF